jgi:hypothetical protein
MTGYLVLKLLHVLALVYWLGGDLGTFFASRFVIDPKLNPGQRAIALKIMLGCDQGPKLCMPLIFACGFDMASSIGLIPGGPALSGAVWLIALLWFANVNYLYFTQNKAAKARIGRIDLWFRVLVVLVLGGVALTALLSGAFIPARWLAAKVLVFAALVACGIYIRLRLKPFVPAFTRLMTEGSTPELEQTMSTSLSACRPAVYLIWIGLVFNTALGLHLINF